MFFVFTAFIFDKAYTMLNGLSVINTNSFLIFYWFAFFFFDIAFYSFFIGVKLASLIIISFFKTFPLITKESCDGWPLDLR